MSNEVIVRLDGLTPIHGQATITAGTRVRLSATSIYLAQGVRIRMATASTGILYIGGATVSSANGYQLAPGESVLCETRDLSAVYCDCSVTGAVVSWFAL